MHRHFSILIPFALLIHSSIAQITFQKTYVGDGTTVHQTMEGGYILNGFLGFGPGNRDLCLMKTNAYGDTVWTKFMGGQDDDLGFDVVQTPDSGFIVAG